MIDAEIVAAPFEEGRFWGVFGKTKHHGQVFFPELSLQRKGVGGDYDAEIFGGVADGRKQVGKCFTHAGAGFDQCDVRLSIHCGLDSTAGFHLLRAWLKARQALCDNTVGSA